MFRKGIYLLTASIIGLGTLAIFSLQQPTFADSTSNKDMDIDDIIFSIGVGDNLELASAHLNTLIIFDLQTLTHTVFYQNLDASFIQGLSWSPNNELLSIYIQEEKKHPQVCLVNRVGQLQLCLEDKPTMYNFQITWSEDSQSVFFVTHSETNTGRTLIEASVGEGKRIRDIYDFEDEILSLEWSADVSIVVENAGLFGELDFPRAMLNLSMNYRTYLNTILGADYELEFVCQSVSPITNEISILATSTQYSGRKLIIVDTNGEIFSQFDLMQNGLSLTCPLWTPNEEKIIIFGTSNQTQETMVYVNDLDSGRRFQLNLGYKSLLDPQLSFNAEYIVGLSQENEIVLIDIENEVITVFDSPSSILHYPIWYPEIKDE